MRWNQVNSRAEDALQLCLQTRQAEQAYVLRQIHGQIHIAAIAVLAACDAAEHAQSGYAVTGGGRNHIVPSAA